jgi:DNA transposition AAA+ family ATPase
MNKVQKEQIKDALDGYLKKHNISQNKFATTTGINVSWISNIRAGNEMIGETPIADKWYRQIADAIGFKIDKEYWHPRETPQLIRIIPTLEDAKAFGYTRIIIGETGSGKTYALDLFAKQHPADLFAIKIGSSDNLGDILDKLIDKLKIQTGRTKSKKIRDIINHLRKMKNEGHSPMIAFDEVEFMKVATICSVKELYDSLIGVCSILLMGTQQFIDNLEKLVRKDKTGMRQFYRRVKFGIVNLPPVDRSFKLFLNGDYPADIKQFLCQNCDNYGELHDVLVPSMREADRLDAPLTINLIRNTLGI